MISRRGSQTFLCYDTPALNLPLIYFVCVSSIDFLAELAPRTLTQSAKAVNTQRVEKKSFQNALARISGGKKGIPTKFPTLSHAHAVRCLL